MSYNVKVNQLTPIRILASNATQAWEALKNYVVSRGDTPADTFADELHANGWEVTIPEDPQNYLIDGLDWDGGSWHGQENLLIALAPYVAAGELQVIGEDGEVFGYFFQWGYVYPTYADMRVKPNSFGLKQPDMPPPMKEKPTTKRIARVPAYVCLYEHRQGTDSAVYMTYEEADVAQADIARLYWSERQDLDAPEDHSSLSDEEVGIAYFEENEREFWTVERTMLTIDIDDLEQKLRAGAPGFKLEVENG